MLAAARAGLAGAAAAAPLPREVRVKACGAPDEYTTPVRSLCSGFYLKISYNVNVFFIMCTCIQRPVLERASASSLLMMCTYG